MPILFTRNPDERVEDETLAWWNCVIAMNATENDATSIDFKCGGRKACF
jgi:hypothetical protein